MTCEMRVLGRGVCAAVMCAVLCVSGRSYGVGISFEGEATGTTVTDLMTRDGAHIFAESDGGSSQVKECASPSGTKCLGVKTVILSKGVCFGVTTNEAGQVGTGFVQPDSRVLAFEAQILPTMFDEPLDSMPLAAPVKAMSALGAGGEFRLAVYRCGMAVAVDGDIAVYPLELLDDMDEPVATNWCVLAGVREGDAVVTRSYTLENANGSPLPPVGDGWHKIVLRRMIVDGAVRYSVAINGTETRSVGDGATNFLSVAATPADPVRAFRFVGTGMVNGIVLPDEKEPCLFGYEDDGDRGRRIVSYLGEGPSIVIPSSIDGVSVWAVSSLDCSNPEEIREIVVPTNITKLFGLDAFWNLERLVFADEIPFANVNQSALLHLLMRTDAIYYPRAYAAKWQKALKNLGYGGRYGSYSGAWTGEACLDAKAVPAGFVNVITEIKGSGGAIAVPENWPTDYPKFQQLYGNDLTKALTLSSGKFDAAGKPMLVWQDYVAGTDPTDESSKFTANVDFVGGKPVVTWKPDLNEEGTKSIRKYTIHGKKSLSPAESWVEVQQGDEAGYNFFKVTVEMK